MSPDEFLVMTCCLAWTVNSLHAVKLNTLYASYVRPTSVYIHRVSRNVPRLACYNFDAHEWILTFFGRNVTNKVDNQKTFTMPPQITCASVLHGKARKHENHTFHSVGLCYTHTMHLCAIFLKENELSSS